MTVGASFAPAARAFERNVDHVAAGEPVIAVDPSAPGRLLEEDSTSVRVSGDGGHTWTAVAAGQVDPAVAVDPAGRLIAHSSSAGRYPLDGFLITVSSDHGRTWSAPVQTFQHPDVAPQDGRVTALGWDRPWLAADPQTSTVYASISVHTEQSGGDLADPSVLAAFLGCEATVFDNALLYCGRRYVSASHDHGASFGAAHPIDSAGYPDTLTGGFSGIPMAAHGVLATAYYATSAPSSTCPCLVFETSTDDGAHWSRHVVPGAHPVASNGAMSAFNNDPSRPPYLYPLISDSPSVELGPYPAADPAHPGRYAVLMPDATRSKLLVYATSDGGATWGAPAVLRDGANDTLERPWLAFAPTGALAAFWRDDHGREGSPFDAVVAVAPPRSTAFAAPVRLNAATAPASKNFQDDNSAVAASCDHVYATWGDTRADSRIEPWFGSYAFATATGRRSPRTTGSPSAGPIVGC